MTENNEELIVPNNINSLNQNVYNIKNKIYKINNKINNTNETVNEIIDNVNDITDNINDITDNITNINNNITSINEKINSDNGNIKTGEIEAKIGYLTENIEDDDESSRIVNKQYVDDKISHTGNVDFEGRNDFITSERAITTQGTIEVGVDNEHKNPTIILEPDGTITSESIEIKEGYVIDEILSDDEDTRIVNKKYVDEHGGGGGGIDPTETLKLKNNDVSMTAAGSIYVGYDYDHQTGEELNGPKTIELNKDGSIKTKESVYIGYDYGNEIGNELGDRSIELNKDGSIYSGNYITTDNDDIPRYKAIELNKDGSIYSGYDINNNTPITSQDKLHQYKRGMIIDNVGNINIKSGVIRDNITSESDEKSIVNKSYIDNNFINKSVLVPKTGETENKIYTKDNIDDNFYKKYEINNNFYTKSYIDTELNNYATKSTVESLEDTMDGIIDGTTKLNSVNVNDKASIDNNGNISGVSFKTDDNTFAESYDNKTNLTNISNITTDKITIINSNVNKEIIDIETVSSNINDDNDNKIVTSKKYVDTEINSLINETINPINQQVNTNTTDIVNIKSDVNNLKITVGDNTDGLVKDVNDINTTIGDENSGIIQQINLINQQLGTLAQNYYVEHFTEGTYPPTQYDTDIIFYRKKTSTDPDPETYKYELMEWDTANNIYILKNVPNNTSCIVKDDATYIKTGDTSTGQTWIKNEFNFKDTLVLTNALSMVASGEVKIGGNNDNPPDITLKPTVLGEKGGIISKVDISTNKAVCVGSGDIETNNYIMVSSSDNTHDYSYITSNKENINVESNLTINNYSINVKNNDTINASIDKSGKITGTSLITSNIELNNNNNKVSSLKYDNDKLILSSDDKTVEISSGVSNSTTNRYYIDITPDIENEQHQIVSEGGISINGNTTFNNNATFNNITLGNKTVNNVSTSGTSASENKDNYLTTQGYVDKSINDKNTFDTLNVNNSINVSDKLEIDSNGNINKINPEPTANTTIIYNNGNINGGSITGTSLHINVNNNEVASIDNTGAISGSSLNVSGSISGGAISGNELVINSNNASISSSGAISGKSFKLNDNTVNSISTAGESDNDKLTSQGYVDNKVSTSISNIKSVSLTSGTIDNNNISQDKDIVNKEYVDNQISPVSTKLNSIVDDNKNIQGLSYKIIGNNNAFAVDDSDKTKLQYISNISAESGTVENTNKTVETLDNNSIINKNNLTSYVSSYTNPFDPTQQINLSGNTNNTSLTTTNNVIVGYDSTSSPSNKQVVLDGSDGSISADGSISGGSISGNSLSINNNSASISNTGAISGKTLTLTNNKTVSNILTSSDIQPTENKDNYLTTQGYIDSNFINKSALVPKSGETENKIYTQANTDELFATKSSLSDYALKSTVNNIINGTQSLTSINVNSNTASISNSGDISGKSLKLNDNNTVSKVSTTGSSASTDKDIYLTTQGYVDNQISSVSSTINNVSTKLNGIVDNNNNLSGKTLTLSGSSDTSLTTDKDVYIGYDSSTPANSKIKLTSSTGNINTKGSISGTSLNVSNKLEIDTSGNINKVNEGSTNTTIISNNGNINGASITGTSLGISGDIKGTTFTTKDSNSTNQNTFAEYYSYTDTSTTPSTTIQGTKLNNIFMDILYLKKNNSQTNYYQNNKLNSVNNQKSSNNSNYSININKTITHNTLIDGNIDNYHIGDPVFLIDNHIYYLENINNNSFKYIEINKDNYLKNSVNQVSKITNKNNGKFIGVITAIHPANTLLKIDDFNNCIKIDNDTIDFATHGDYIFKVDNNKIKHQTTSGTQKIYEIGDEILYDGRIIDPEQPLSRKLEKMIVGTITYIPEDNISFVSVFKN